MKKIFIFLFAVCNVLQTISSQNVLDIISKNADEDVIVIDSKEQLNIQIIDNKLAIKRSFSKQQLFITTDKVYYAKEGLHFDNFHEITNINAFTDNTYNNLKRNVHKNRNPQLWEVKKFEDHDILSQGVFFGDSKQKTFTYPAISKKSITNLTYTTKVLDPHFINPFYLGNRIPILATEFSIKVAKNIDLAYKTFHLDSVDVTFTKEEKENNTMYSWKFKNLKKANFDYDFSPLYYLPQIAVYIKSYTINGVKKNVLNNVGDLYGWYQSLIKNINTTNQNELKSITEKLIQPFSTDEEKIKAIYYYVQNKINYIAFEDGLNGFIPRDAMNVFTKKYGDCKDMANILNEMLHYANIPSYLTWIGTRRKPYSYKELPTTFTDNHMITAVRYNNQFLFLDATAKYLPFGYPSPFIQGKEALIGISKENYKLVNVPEVEGKKNYKEVISRLSFDKNLDVKGTHSVTLTGYEKLYFNHKFSNKKNEDKNFIRQLFNLGNRKTAFTNDSYSDVSLQNDSIKVQFTSNFKKNYKQIDGKIYLKLQIDNDLKHDFVKNKRKKYAKKINYKYVTKYITQLSIPAGYSIEYLPKNSTYTNKDFGFNSSYNIENNTIYATKTIYVNTLKVPVTKISNWNNFVKKLSKNNKKSIILKKK